MLNNFITLLIYSLFLCVKILDCSWHCSFNYIKTLILPVISWILIFKWIFNFTSSLAKNRIKFLKFNKIIRSCWLLPQYWNIRLCKPLSKNLSYRFYKQLFSNCIWFIITKEIKCFFYIFKISSNIINYLSMHLLFPIISPKSIIKILFI